MADRLASAWSRVRRADAHLREVKRRVTAFERSHPYKIGETDDSGPDEVTFRVRLVKKPNPAWDPIVADCLHNYRAALDHAVWVLTERHGKPTGHRTFPIYLSRDEFRSNLRKCIGDTGRSGAKTVIERFQPYKAGSGRDHHPLWLLHELDRFAKHRRLGELVVRFPTYEFSATGPLGDSEVTWDDHFAAVQQFGAPDWGDPLEGDTVRVHVRLFSHWTDEVEMYFQPVPEIWLFQPHLRHRGPIPLPRTLVGIQVTVRDVLTQLAPICEKP